MANGKSGARLLLLALLCAAGGCAWQATKLLLAGDSVALRERDESVARSDPDRPDLLILALDGVERHLLYPMLRDGRLPELANLLGGDLDRVYFDDVAVSSLPSSTATSWASIVTGETPARHGVAGNEFFIRDSGRFAAPVPVTIGRGEPVLRIYTEGYANELLERPTVYERMRQREPGVRIWVAMHQYYAGADRLLLTDRTVLLDAVDALLQTHVAGALSGEQSLTLFHEFDQEAIENTIEALEDEVPDVLTVYFPGLDHYAHVADKDPDAARREYLTEAIEPLVAELREALQHQDALSDRYVVITSDHGHTSVVRDDAHSLGMSGGGEPPDLLERAGFTVRPFQMEVEPDRHFDTVLAYQGAMAYVYVADRSTCRDGKRPCDWQEPARPRDIEAVAEAFHRNNETGDLVPEMRGVLDLILVRVRPSDGAETDVFEVYRGGGRTQPVQTYLQKHPRPAYVALEERLRELGMGPHGDRAGDVILIAHNGNRERAEDRYYFASLYHSWHGSPSHRDSDVPLILAHTGRSRAQLRAAVTDSFRGRTSQRHTADLLLRLRYGEQVP